MRNLTCKSSNPSPSFAAFRASRSLDIGQLQELGIRELDKERFDCRMLQKPVRGTNDFSVGVYELENFKCVIETVTD